MPNTDNTAELLLSIESQHSVGQDAFGLEKAEGVMTVEESSVSLFLYIAV